MDIKICDAYHSTCTTGIDAKGYVHRRCTTNDTHTADEFSDKFETCEGSKCNCEAFPRDSLKCYQCKDNEECDHISEESKGLKPEACGLPSEYDQCFTFMDKSKK